MVPSYDRADIHGPLGISSFALFQLVYSKMIDEWYQIGLSDADFIMWMIFLMEVNI